MTTSNVLLFPGAVQPPSPPPDAAVRAEALDIRRSFIVQAPAGSGKTTLLLQRLLRLLADDSVTQPEQVLAITFTNAATAELRDRILRVFTWLRAENPATKPPTDPLTLDLARSVLAREAALGWDLLSQPHRLNIRTIDSVCAEIARSLPLLSGSGGRLTPATDAAPLYREAARRTLLLLGRGDTAFDAALRHLLLHRDGNLDNCESLLAGMLAWRDQWGELLWGNLIPIAHTDMDDAWLDANVLPRLERALDHAICATLSHLDRLFPRDVLADLSHLAGHLGHHAGYSGNANPIAACAGLHGSPDAVAGHLDRWLAFIHLLTAPSNKNWRSERGITGKNLAFDYDRRHPHHASLASILDQLRHRDDLLAAINEVRELPPPRYPADQWAVAKSLFRILGRALVELQLVFAERNQCDFTEISLLACQALGSASGVEDLSSALGARLQHLLVDEMQDTSTGQYRLLELLTSSWDGASQTVFLVGDPHQSIYLFRQARVERFVHSLTSCRLGDVPLTALALTANFRSQRPLVGQFNSAFRLIFPPAQAGTEHDPQALPYDDAQPTCPATSALGLQWQATLQPARPRLAPGVVPPLDLSPTQAHHDAREIVSLAHQWLTRPLPPERTEPWKIAILVRSRDHLKQITPALHAQAVPFRAIDIETLRERQEVLDLTALTRALLHPADRVAALAVLRAPWCGLSLADLHKLTGQDDPALRERTILSLIDDRIHLLQPEAQLRATRVQTVLRTALATRARHTTAQIVERAWRSLGGDAPLTPAERTNARRFFELLDALEASAGRVDPTQLDARLSQLFAEPNPIPSGQGFVELLTIHKAKGLEWDLVFVPALERRPAAYTSRLLTWATLESSHAPDAEAHVMLAPIAARGDNADRLTKWLRRHQRDRERAENRRLFYVACTRARQELHLYAAPTLRQDGSPSVIADTLLAAAWPAAHPHFFAAQSSSSVSSDDTDGLELAASAEEDAAEPSLDISQVIDENLLPTIYPPLVRLPLSFDPLARLRSPQPTLATHSAEEAHQADHIARPEGSLAARAFGNTIHACIELLTTHTAAGISHTALLAELPSWRSRIAALLRAEGLPPTKVTQLTRDAITALDHMLRDPDGQWLLAAHTQAAAEIALTTAAGSTVRADRIFVAGAEPRSSGTTHLWIVDYKTASHSGSGLEEFLTTQRTTYAAQLEAYARVLAPAHSVTPEAVRLALYLPTLADAPRLIHWPLTTEN